VGNMCWEDWQSARGKFNLFPLGPSFLVCDRVGALAAALSPFNLSIHFSLSARRLPTMDTTIEETCYCRTRVYLMHFEN
jgi:hypothetical protein